MAGWRCCSRALSSRCRYRAAARQRCWNGWACRRDRCGRRRVRVSSPIAFPGVSAPDLGTAGVRAPVLPFVQSRPPLVQNACPSRRYPGIPDGDQNHRSGGQAFASRPKTPPTRRHNAATTPGDPMIPPAFDYHAPHTVAESLRVFRSCPLITPKDAQSSLQMLAIARYVCALRLDRTPFERAARSRPKNSQALRRSACSAAWGLMPSCWPAATACCR